jgi:hypothetical protein
VDDAFLILDQLPFWELGAYFWADNKIHPKGQKSGAPPAPIRMGITWPLVSSPGKFQPLLT